MPCPHHNSRWVREGPYRPLWWERTNVWHCLSVACSSPFCIQPSGMPHGPSCCWPCWALLLAWCSAWAPLPMAQRTGGSEQAASPWSCQVTNRLPASLLRLIWTAWFNQILPLSGFLALLALAIYTGVTVTFFGKRFLDWRFSWSYIIGWVAVILAFAAGVYCLFKVKF